MKENQAERQTGIFHKVGKKISGCITGEGRPYGNAVFGGEFTRNRISNVRNVIRETKRRKEIEGGLGDIVWIWPGYAPEEQALHAINVLREKLGLEQGALPRHFREPSRLIPNDVSPAGHYRQEIDRIVKSTNKPEHISAIVVTDVVFRDEKGKVDENFVSAMQIKAKEIKAEFFYIPSHELFGSDDPNLIKEMKNLRFSSSYWEHEIDLLTQGVREILAEQTAEQTPKELASDKAC